MKTFLLLDRVAGLVQMARKFAINYSNPGEVNAVLQSLGWTMDVEKITNVDLFVQDNRALIHGMGVRVDVVTVTGENVVYKFWYDGDDPKLEVDRA